MLWRQRHEIKMGSVIFRILFSTFVELGFIKDFSNILQDKGLGWEVGSGSQTHTFVGSLEHFGRSIFNFLKKEKEWLHR